VGGSW